MAALRTNVVWFDLVAIRGRRASGGVEDRADALIAGWTGGFGHGSSPNGLCAAAGRRPVAGPPPRRQPRHGGEARRGIGV
jgi:hypothetical protein